MKKGIKILTIAAVLFFAVSVANAQFGGPGGGAPGGGGSGGGIPGSGGTPGVPFDGGLSLILLAAGAGVGAKKRKTSINL